MKVKKLFTYPHPDANQHQNLTTSRRSPLVNAYHVLSTSLNALASYPAYRQIDRQTDKMTDRQTDRQTDKMTDRHN